MLDIMNFYMDDSGTRHPDRVGTQHDARRPDWFSLGGVLIAERDEANARLKYDEFCGHWGISHPLHSADIRAKSGKFQWLNTLSDSDYKKFIGSLERFLLRLPVVGLACVIDRPGYNHRYLEKYGRQRWSLCKTSFSIAVERAAKFAIARGLKLRVMPERCSKKDDNKLKQYYEALKSEGAPFESGTSSRYAPLTATALSACLYEFRLKTKSSPLAQIADLYLWPICAGGYNNKNHAFRALMRNDRLLDCLCEKKDVTELGIKYSCFDLVKTNG